MKHQYVGDINDYRKYALLRALSAGGTNRIGVCWMLTPDDGGTDGGKLSYLAKPDEFRGYDPELFDVLASVSAEPDQRRLSEIEASGIVPGATYFNEQLPDDFAGRLMFMKRAREGLADAELVFFDPDNGMETSLPKGRKSSSKFVYLDELSTFYRMEKSLLIYQHFPRVERAAFIRACADRIEEAAPGSAIWAFTTAHVVFFLAVHPESPARLAITAIEASRCWPPGFLDGEMIVPQTARNAA